MVTSPFKGFAHAVEREQLRALDVQLHHESRKLDAAPALRRSSSPRRSSGSRCVNEGAGADDRYSRSSEGFEGAAMRRSGSLSSASRAAQAGARLAARSG
jgi:hypothetical protein